MGTLILDNPDYFVLVTLDTDSLKINQINFNIDENDYLKRFNSFSAFYNGNEKIYLSGGETSNDQVANSNSYSISNFIEIDLE